MGQIKRRATKIRHKALGSGIFCLFPNSNIRRTEVAGDVIPSVAVHYFGIDVRATGISLYHRIICSRLNERLLQSKYYWIFYLVLPDLYDTVWNIV